MTRFFLTLLGISAGCGAVIFVLLLLGKPLRRRYAAKWSCLIWGVLALRLLLPVSLPAALAPVALSFPAVRTELSAGLETESESVSAAQETLRLTDGNIVSVVPDTDSVSTITETAESSAAPVFSLNWLALAAALWLCGVGVFVLLQIVRNLSFRRSLRRWSRAPLRSELNTALRGLSRELGLRREVELVICSGASSPMLVGLLRPQLILPREDYAPEELHFILCHELTHCKRGHLWFKLLLTAANALHWFNPLVYRMVREAEADLERACDDQVLQSATPESRRDYSLLILNGIGGQSAPFRPLSTQLYCDKKVLKNRILNILSAGKKRSAIALTLLLTALLLAFGLVSCGTAETGEPAESADQIAGETASPEETPGFGSPDDTQLEFEHRFYSSNRNGRYDSFQSADKSSSEAGTQALTDYYSEIADCFTEDGYNTFVSNNIMLSYDKLAADYDCTFGSEQTVSETSESSTEERIVCNSSTQISVTRNIEKLGTVELNTQFIFVLQEDGSYLIDSFYVQNMDDLREFLEGNGTTSAESVDETAANTAAELVANGFLTTFYSSNQNGRYDTYQTASLKSSGNAEDALTAYYSGVAEYLTEESYEAFLESGRMLLFDQTAAEYGCTLEPFIYTTSLEDWSTEENVICNYQMNLNVTIPESDTTADIIISDTTLNGQLTLTLQESGEYRISDFAISVPDIGQALEEFTAEALAEAAE